ncbi:MAG: efflux RND transporter periplasmic adaptor subunit [Deltaproteobacteria bacterium]
MSMPLRSAASACLMLAALLLAAACSSNEKDRAEAAPPTPGTPASVPVTLATARLAVIERKVHFVGTMKAGAEAEVAAEVDGRLISVEANMGDAVGSGQILATIDGAALEARLREASAVLVRAQNELDRASRLGTEGVISQQRLDDLASQRDIAQARRDVLAIEVENTHVRAPFTGRIAKRLADVGSYIRRGSTLFVLVSDNPLRLRGEVPERYTAEIAVGQEVEAKVVAYPDLAIHGRLTRISAAADASSRALSIEALIPNGDGRLKPGFFTKADIITRREDAILIPAEAVIRAAGVQRVFLVDDNGIAHTRMIRTGVRRGAEIEVLEGLQIGDRVATSGLARLWDGARVSLRQAWDGRHASRDLHS